MFKVSDTDVGVLHRWLVTLTPKYLVLYGNIRPAYIRFRLGC